MIEDWEMVLIQEACWMLRFSKASTFSCGTFSNTYTESNENIVPSGERPIIVDCLTYNKDQFDSFSYFKIFFGRTLENCSQK